MTDDSVRQALLDLPVASVPSELDARLRVMASHEFQRRVQRYSWLTRLRLEVDHLLKPLAVPAAGGLLSSVLLFTALVDTLNVQRYLQPDIPIGAITRVSMDDLSPFMGREDVMVEVTVDESGRVTDFVIPSGKVSKEQYREIANLILYSSFNPATAYGKPISGKVLVAVHHINVHG